MGPDELAHLYGPARRALERARWGVGLRLAGPALLVTVIALLLRGLDASCIAAGGALCVAMTVSGWRGGAHAEVALPALLAGVAPLIAPALTRSAGHLCVEGGCVSYCLLACGLGGFVGGVVLGARARPRGAAWLTGALICCLTGTLGCAFAGGPGLLGMVVGGVVGALPAAWWAARAPIASP